jgi:hypothetical protein
MMIRDCNVLSYDGYGDKVLKLRDGRILKLFRLKRWVSSNLVFPYAKRFKANAEKLLAAGIPTVTDISTFNVPHIKRTAVLYMPLGGETLRMRIKRLGIDRCLVTDIASFISRIHIKGIYFRSIHFGNIIVLSDGGLGLIDIADMKVFNRPLGVKHRLRNFRHFTRYREDKMSISPMIMEFAECYVSRYPLPDQTKQILVDGIFDIFSP